MISKKISLILILQLLLLTSAFANEKEAPVSLATNEECSNTRKSDRPLALAGFGLGLGDRTSSTFATGSFRILDRFYLVGEAGSVHYHNMDFGMNGMNSKLQYDLRTLAIYGRYDFPIYDTFGFAAQAGVEKLEGDVILASPRISTGKKNHVDKTIFVARPMFYHQPKIGNRNFLFINYGLNIRAIKSYKLSTNELASNTDVREEFPNSMAMMPFVSVGVYF